MTVEEETKMLEEIHKEIMKKDRLLYSYEIRGIIDKFIDKGRWIPVSERLPEKNMACLVSVGNFNLTQVAVYSDLMQTINHKIFYQGDYGHDNFRNITEYVKAWQPLPKPYGSEGEQ